MASLDFNCSAGILHSQVSSQSGTVASYNGKYKIIANQPLESVRLSSNVERPVRSHQVHICFIQLLRCDVVVTNVSSLKKKGLPHVWELVYRVFLLLPLRLLPLQLRSAPLIVIGSP